MTADGTVYVVDDDEVIRDSLTVLLGAAGFTVAAYPSADAFLAASTQSAGCVLIDVRMPGMGGLELQEELTHRGRRIPVILMTGHADVPLAVKAMKAGAVDFVKKPFDEKAMLAAIQRAFRLGVEAARAEAEGYQIGSRVAQLTPREREVLEALIAGKPNKIIAFDLSISPRTVEIHRARVMEKMEARTLSDLVRMALAVGLGPNHA
jgi:two-component system response regulator FixJ